MQMVSDKQAKNSEEAVAVVDYGMGNVASVANMIRKLGRSSTLIKDPELIARASKIVLPGVGAFDAGVHALRMRGLEVAIMSAIQNKAVVLGICLGFQLLFNESEEGRLPGLGLIQGRVRRFSFESLGLRVPHMGWNTVTPTRDSVLFPAEHHAGQRFYFVHSYFAECANAEDVTATCNHGVEFACALERERVLGVQFHPEKSHQFGMNLFKRFLDA